MLIGSVSRDNITPLVYKGFRKREVFICLISLSCWESYHIRTKGSSSQFKFPFLASASAD